MGEALSALHASIDAGLGVLLANMLAGWLDGEAMVLSHCGGRR